MNPSMTCTYETTSMTLIVSSPVTSQAASGTVLTFSVDNFRNPYNGKPSTGYQI
jgi:hypothetical protein